MALAAGTRLGPYEIVVQVGAGGMGEVYSARDTRLDRIVAIKILPTHRSSQADARERFEREGRAIAALNHPHICQLYDVGTEGPISYLVLEFLEGESLADRLGRGAFPLNELLRCAQEVTDALDTAHRRGIIHRDLKPGNIFLTAHGECKVLDFGLAKLVREEHGHAAATATASSPMTVAGTAVGTVAYMSPEQARGETLDERTDIFSMGAVIYEMATGQPAFRGSTSAVIFKAILDETPVDISLRNSILPHRLNEIVNKALEKDRNLRYQSASDLRADLQRLKRDSESGTIASSLRVHRSFSRWRWIGTVAAVVLAVAAVALYRYLGHRAAPRSTAWEQLTFFTDSAVYPALSPDGRMLAFIRGSDSFFGPGQIYVKFLPDGQPVQLTHDSTEKLSPAFSTDGTNIAYSTFDPWSVWELPVLGGDPHILLPNASSLTWIEGGKRLLFSEIKEGLHMVLVTTDEGRGQSRDVYVPPSERGMAHHSYLSPDGKSVLVVEMGGRGDLLPCRVVPFQGNAAVRLVGPPDGACLSGAWSLDGKWVYLTANKNGQFHIWRQRFPDGDPEQLTFGPTTQEGIAMAPDGKSFITAVGSQDSTVWLHDNQGDHQISSEGNAIAPSLAPDGKSLFYLMANGQTPGYELRVRDLTGDKTESLLPGYFIQADYLIKGYSISRDGKEVAFVRKDQNGHPGIWVAPTNRRSSPLRISSETAIEDSPFFLPDGDLVFRAIEGSSNFLYRMKADGTGRRKISSQRVFDAFSVSPDGRWLLAVSPGPDQEHTAQATAFAVDGSTSVPICLGYCHLIWDSTGEFAHLYFPALYQGTYTLPVLPDTGLPKLPPAGIARIEDLAAAKAAPPIPETVESALSPSIYAYSRQNTRRNLYRIPLQ